MSQAGALEAVPRPTYKGNVGNLMQHWTLCEVVTAIAAAEHGTSCLNYVDAHAMAPVASSRPSRNDKSRQTFDRVRDGLSEGSAGEQSVYEQAWHRLAQGRAGYPNSAAFVEDVWEGRVSMLLCEADRITAAELDAWARDRNEVTVFEGDWRERFAQGLPNAPMTLLSFDPYSYNRRRHVEDWCRGNLYPSDLERTVDALDGVQGGVLIQLSTYGMRNDNSPEAVSGSVEDILAKGGLRSAAEVKVNARMMSLVYVRGIDMYAELADMPKRFKQWLDTCSRPRRSDEF